MHYGDIYFHRESFHSNENDVKLFFSTLVMLSTLLINIYQAS